MHINITSELVERMARAARNARDNAMPGSTHKTWEQLDDGARDRWRNAMRAALAEVPAPAQWYAHQCAEQGHTPDDHIDPSEVSS